MKTGEILEQAEALHRQGRLPQAKALYDRILAEDPAHVGALQGLGVLAYQTGQVQIANGLLERAATLAPRNAAVHFHRGNLFNRMGLTERALAAYEQALALEPDDAAANANRGVMLERLGRVEDAIRSFDCAIAAKPDFTPAHFNRGNALQKSRRFVEAVESYDRVLALKPDHADAWNNRGNALKEIGRTEEALAAHARAAALKPNSADVQVNHGHALMKAQPRDALAAYDLAIGLEPSRADARIGRGNALAGMGRHREALASFDQAVALESNSAIAQLGRGNALFELRQIDGAMAAYDGALAIDASLAKAWLGRGNIVYLRKHWDQALAAYDKALALDPVLENAWEGRGNVLQQQKRPDLAAEAYGRLLAVNPTHPFIKGALLHQKMLACDWDGADVLTAEIERDIAQGNQSAQPFGWQGVSASPESLKRCAEIYADALYPPRHAAAFPAPRPGKIRIGYLSGDFRDQATSQLLVGVLEQHDRVGFEIYAFDNGYDDGSEIRRRITGAVDEVISIARLGDDEAAAAISNRNIDILINLNGWFGDHRMGVFARRPAPIQVNWLGFPGTLGAVYMDYIIADKTVIPECDAAFFAEKIAWLPHCYQANDDKKSVADAGHRAAHGLPDDAFVFCCFNNSYKILPEMLARWIRILARVPGSVLWLIEENAVAAANLRKQAEVHGIEAARLIFAPRQPLPQHLARHRLADLFLDTLPYNAHTTASDALWAGLPLLTCRGTAFAGRVAASLLEAVGLPELIAETPDQYETMAVELARSPHKLADLQRDLSENRRVMPLFNTARFTRALEAVYAAMQERRRASLAPGQITISG